jgi:hypothetical protein
VTGGLFESEIGENFRMTASPGYAAHGFEFAISTGEIVIRIDAKYKYEINDVVGKREKVANL